MAESSKTELQAQLAESERRVAQLERRMQAMIQWVAGITAEVYCMEIGIAARENGRIGIDTLKFPAPSTRGAYDSMRERMIEALSVG